jgi:AbrB family looped-hinge helix DNA binding protein
MMLVRRASPVALSCLACCPQVSTRDTTLCRARAFGAAPQPYNGTCLTYNGVVSTSEHIMTVSQNGQVSIPAAARARWNVRRVIVVDLGDRVVVRPASDGPVADLEGKYKGRGPSSDQARRRARQAETSRAR